MLDKDLATLYGTETKAINLAVRSEGLRLQSEME
jgi:hypothetical protein